jgi:hypothetical protein
VQAGAEHERRARLHDVELLPGDIADGRPQPARVLQPDAGEHLDGGRDHVGRVEAAAEPGLDHRRLDAPRRHLGVGSGGERLELGHVVVGLGGAIDLLRGSARALHRGPELLGGEVDVVDPDPLAEGDQVRRGVGPGEQPVRPQDLRDHPRRRGLSVRADDVQ